MNTQLFAPFFQEDMPSVFILLCVTSMVLFFMIGMLSFAIRIVPEYARMAIFRLGRFVGVRGPGLMLLLPFIDRGIQVDLREKKETINSEATTQDNARLNVQIGLGYRIVAPEKTVLNVPNLTDAVREAARNQLKSVVGDLSYGDVIHDRAQVETALENRLGEVMKLWGSEVTSLEIVELQRS